MVTRPPELHVFASWEGFLATTAAAEAAATATTGGPDASAAAGAAALASGPPAAEDDPQQTLFHYELPPLRLVAHPNTPLTLPSLLVGKVLYTFALLAADFALVAASAEIEAVVPLYVTFAQLRPFTDGVANPQQQQQRHRVGVLLAVGPEGGWVPSEVDLLQQQLRCLPFQLTDKVLKCETALSACLTQLTLCFEDSFFCPLLRSADEVYAAATAAVATNAAVDTAAAVGAPGAACEAKQKEKQRRQGEREVLRFHGGFLMTFPKRYTTKATVAE